MRKLLILGLLIGCTGKPTLREAVGPDNKPLEQVMCPRNADDTLFVFNAFFETGGDAKVGEFECEQGIKGLYCATNGPENKLRCRPS